MDHCIESSQCIRFVGNVLGFLDVGQISYDDVLGCWYLLFSVTSAFSIARMQNDLVTLIG